MIEPLRYKIFRDTILRLKYYPENFNITIFCISNEAKNIFIKLIKEIIGEQIKIIVNDNLAYIKNNAVKCTIIVQYPFEGGVGAMTRNNLIIANAKYPYSDFIEIFNPIANIDPSSGVYYYYYTYDIKKYFEYIKKDNEYWGRNIKNEKY